MQTWGRGGRRRENLMSSERSFQSELMKMEVKKRRKTMTMKKEKKNLETATALFFLLMVKFKKNQRVKNPKNLKLLLLRQHLPLILQNFRPS